MTIVIDSLIKLLLSVIANEKTRLIPILYQNLQRDTKPKTRGFQPNFMNGLYEKRRGIIPHDENNFNFPSVQTQSQASAARDNDEIFIHNKLITKIYNTCNSVMLIYLN